MTRSADGCRCVICDLANGHSGRPAFDETLIANIGEHGWGVIMIPAGPASEGWAFTVGLWHTHGLPDLAMFGLDINVMQSCLNLAVDRLLAGTPATAGTRVEGVLTDYPVLLENADPAWYRAFFGTALGFYQATTGLRFLQALWPDNAGVFPDELTFDQRLRDRQPSLWLHPLDHAPGPWAGQF